MPTALIVEDEPEANELLSMLVRLRGYRTESAFSGEEALSKADTAHPDILFLDLMLPDITGYDVCTALKSRRATNAIPIVMVTARIAAENRRKGIKLGANEYIPKPYTPDQIFQAMADADSWRKQIDDLADSGRFSVDTADDLAPLQNVSDLRSLLLARSPIAEEAATLVGQALGEILQRGLDWGRRNAVEAVASIDYRLEPELAQFTLRDLSGWLREDRYNEDGLAEAIKAGRFDSVEFDSSGGLLMLSTRFQRS